MHILKTIALTVLVAFVYFIVYPLLANYRKCQNYVNQNVGVSVPKSQSRIFGIMSEILKFVELAKTKQVTFIFTHILREMYFEGEYTEIPKFVFLQLFLSTSVVIHDVKAIRDMMLSKQSVVDKDARVYNYYHDLFGEAFLFAKGDETWKMKRKVCSHAFYKEKLISMEATMRLKVLEKIEKWNREKPAKVDLSEELGEIFQRIILTISFGEDLQDTLLPYETVDGKVTQLGISKILRLIVNDMNQKASHPLRGFSDRFDRWHLNASERLVLKNSRAVRAFVQEFVQIRRSGKTKSALGTEDFLSHLLADDYFSKPENEIIVVDEMIDFFIAAAQTTKGAVGNMMHHMIRHKEMSQKLLQNIQTCVIEPHLKEDAPVDGKVDLDQAFVYERLRDMDYFASLFNESLRTDPPASSTSIYYMTEAAKLGDLQMPAGQQFQIHIWGVHHNPEQWQRPEEFLPDRFDSESPLYLTPSGQRRDPYSFIPFSGGKRVCFGKTFADYNARIVTSLLVYNFEYEFVDKKYLTETPFYNFMANFDAKVEVTLKSRQ